MTNCFILSWHSVFYGDSKPVDRQLVLNSLDGIPEIITWRASTGAIFIVSEATAQALSEKLRKFLPNLGFVLLPIRVEDVWGWTDPGTWEFIQKMGAKN